MYMPAAILYIPAGVVPEDILNGSCYQKWLSAFACMTCRLQVVKISWYNCWLRDNTSFFQTWMLQITISKTFKSLLVFLFPFLLQPLA